MRRAPLRVVLLMGFAAIALGALPLEAAQRPLPRIEGPWWTVAGNPDLGELNSPKQQVVDFAVWQAADGTWQLWACIRQTKCAGKTRLFYRWEGKRLTDPDWTPGGIALQADPKYGETAGGLQAPHVVRDGARFVMAYGDWEHICLATSADGKAFQREIRADGRTGAFTEGLGTNTRDPMLLRIGNRWHCYYTAYPEQQGAVFCRTSTDLDRWSESVNVAFGGAAGTSPFSAECPHVVAYEGRYYLFRTQRYGAKAQTTVYRSSDPLNFGLNQDRLYQLGTLSVAAPEIVQFEGRYYVAALRPDLHGIQIARLAMEPLAQ